MTVSAVASSVLAPLVDGVERPARVVGVLGSAVYLRAGGPRPNVVALVTRDAVRVPNAVILPGAALPCGLQAGAKATVGAGTVRVGGLVVECARRWSPPRPRLPDAAVARAEELASLVAAPHLAAPARELRSALATGDDTAAEAAAFSLLGLGPGLTPSGDDLLAGALVTVRALGDTATGVERAIAHADRRTPLVSAELLRYAAQGLCIPQLADLIDALGSHLSLRAPLASLLAVGHHSGGDLARGVALALAAAQSPRPPADARARRSPVGAGSSGGARSRR